jgi:hypothetical protein
MAALALYRRQRKIFNLETRTENKTMGELITLYSSIGQQVIAIAWALVLENEILYIIYPD